MRRLGTASALTALAATLLLSGCGSSDDSASDSSDSDYAKSSVDTIEKDAAKAMQSLTSVRLKGSLVEDADTVTMDLKMSDDECVGSASSGDQSFEIVVTGGQSYMKAGAAFWDAQGGGAGTLLGDKWVTGIPNMDQTCPFDGLFDDMLDEKSTGDKVTGTSTVGGVKTVSIENTEEDGETMVTQVALEEPHYILAVKGDKGTDATLSEFNEDVDAKAPAGAMDVSKLGQ